MELPPHLQARDRPRCRHRPLRSRGLCQGRREPQPHGRGWRADPRRQALLLRLPLDRTRLPADRARGGRLARRLRQQPHSQARAHDPGQGRRPRPPDRGRQRPDRPGDDGLSRRPGDRCDAGPRRSARPRRRRDGRRRRAPSALGCRRRRDDRSAHARLRRPAGPLSATAITARRPRHGSRRRAPTAKLRTAISSRWCSPITK